MRKAALVLLLFLLYVLAPVAAMAADANWIGQVYPAGDAQALSKGGKWLGIDGVYPVPGEGSFRTSKGGLSFSFTDGTQMDVGANSEVSLKGLAGGGMVVSLRRGAIGINSPAGDKVAIVTPDGRRYESGPGGFTGGISFDGVKTRTKTLAGNIEAGKGNLARPAGFSEAPSGGKQPVDPPIDPPAAGGALTGLLVGGGFGGIVAGGIEVEDSRMSPTHHASPYIP